LEICLGVPIRIKQNQSISRLQVQPHSAASCGQKEEELVAIVGIERVHYIITFGSGSTSIEATIGPSS